MINSTDTLAFFPELNLKRAAPLIPIGCFSQEGGAYAGSGALPQLQVS